MGVRGDVADVCRSAVVHAVRLLERIDEKSSVGVVEALGLLAAVLTAAPREVRSCVNKLLELLRNLLKTEEDDVRMCVERVYVGFITCFADSMQQDVVVREVDMVCTEISAVIDFVRLFSGQGKENDMLKAMDCVQMCNWYTVLCNILTRLFTASTVPVILPIGRLFQLLVMGIGEMQVDPYQAVDAVVNHESIHILIPVIFRESLRSILGIARICNHEVLPVMHLLGNSIEQRLSQMVLRCDESSIAATTDRCLIYEAVRGLVTIFGGPFQEYVVERFEQLFEEDIKLYKEACQRVQRKPSNTENMSRSRKRRRQNSRRERTKEDLITNDNQQPQTLADGTSDCVYKLVNEGLETCTTLFHQRGLLSEKSIKHLGKLEYHLLSLSKECETTPELLRSISAAAISGGSRRMEAEASILLMPCLGLCLRVLRSSTSSEELRSSALLVRAQCETLVHPRALPILNPSRRHVVVEEQKTSIIPEQQMTPMNDVIGPSEAPVSTENQVENDEHGREAMEVDTTVTKEPETREYPPFRETESNAHQKGEEENGLMEKREKDNIKNFPQKLSESMQDVGIVSKNDVCGGRTSEPPAKKFTVDLTTDKEASAEVEDRSAQNVQEKGNEKNATVFDGPQEDSPNNFEATKLFSNVSPEKEMVNGKEESDIEEEKAIIESITFEQSDEENL